MTRDLGSELASYLAEHGESTALHCARGIRARTEDVIDTLKSDGRFYGPLEGDDRRLYYGARSQLPETGNGPERPGTVRPRGVSHKERLLAVLWDLQPHDHHELYRLGMIVHSRVADLRKDGWQIRAWQEGGSHYYRLESHEPLSRPGSSDNAVPGLTPGVPGHESGQLTGAVA